MSKRPSSPIAYAEPAPRRRFDQRLIAVAIFLSILVAAAALVRLTGPMTGPEVDPNTYLVGP
jgi:hypothetical protein